MAGIAITRMELTAEELRRAAGRSKAGRAARRMLAIALVLAGVDHTTAAQNCAMDRQTLRGEADQETVRGTVSPANARVGQQGTLTRIRATRGTRPRAPCDMRYQWAFARALEPVAFAGSLIGAVCPARGVAAGLVLPFVNTAAMNAHRTEITRSVAPVRRGNDPPDHVLTRLTPCDPHPRRVPDGMAQPPSSCPTISPC